MRAVLIRVLQPRRPEASLTAIVAAVLLSLGTHVSASELTPEIVFPERLVHELLDWIEQTADRDVEATRRAPPDIVLATTGDRIRFGEQSILIVPRIGGLWNTDSRQIFLIEPWRASAPVDLSILLHELVHAVQADAGDSVCNPEAEWEAYSLQVRWLAEHDIPMFVNWNEVLEHASCEEEAPP